MSNQQPEDNELFELNKDTKSTNNVTSEFEDLENQLGKYRDVKAPIHLKTGILAGIKRPNTISLYQFMPIAAAIFIIIFAGILFFNFSNSIEKESAPKIVLQESNSNDVANIIEKELGSTVFKKQKYYALYFSSSLCKPCVDLLAELDIFYMEQKAKNSNFEIIYIELDKHVHKINKPAELHIKKVDYNQLHDKEFFKQYNEGHGPSFVVIDNKGNIVTKHKKNVQRNSFNTVLTAFSDLLAKS